MRFGLTLHETGVLAVSTREGAPELLRWRLFSAAVIITILLGLLHLDFHHAPRGASGAWLVPLGLLFTVLAVAEVLDLLATQNLRPAHWAVYSGSLLVFLAACAPIAWPLWGRAYPGDCPLGKLGWGLAALAIGAGLAFVGEMRRYREPGGVIVHVALAIFVITYVGLLLSFVVILRLFHNHEWGMTALISVVLVVKLADTGAYAAGRLFGKRKLAPRISPGKTVEGLVGGLAAASLASILFARFVVPQLVGPTEAARSGPWWGWLAYGVLLTLVGLLGDLAESMLKRDMGRKDSSRWLPGLGGVLDVLDSVLFAAPVAYVCWAAGLIGPLH